MGVEEIQPLRKLKQGADTLPIADDHLSGREGPGFTCKIRDERVIRDTHANTCLGETGLAESEIGLGF